jgi:hypothetical protein
MNVTRKFVVKPTGHATDAAQRLGNRSAVRSGYGSMPSLVDNDLIVLVQAG